MRQQRKRLDQENSIKLFDVSIGANDGAEICELVWLYILTVIHKTDFTSVGLYRDDGLAVIRSASGRSSSGSCINVCMYIYNVEKFQGLTHA